MIRVGGGGVGKEGGGALGLTRVAFIVTKLQLVTKDLPLWYMSSYLPSKDNLGCDFEQTWVKPGAALQRPL